MLLESGTDVNATAELGGTALQEASGWGYLDIMQLMLDHGTDVNATAESDGTALRVASKYGHLKVVQLLLDHGAVMGYEEIQALIFDEEDPSYYREIVRLLLSSTFPELEKEWVDQKLAEWQKQMKLKALGGIEKSSVAKEHEPQAGKSRGFEDVDCDWHLVETLSLRE